MFLFDPPENFRKPKVFRCFPGDQKGTLGRKVLMKDYVNFIDWIELYWLRPVSTGYSWICSCNILGAKRRGAEGLGPR